jgi:energy-coupling factor transporter transmembrane protein EcfT
MIGLRTFCHDFFSIFYIIFFERGWLVGFFFKMNTKFVRQWSKKVVLSWIFYIYIFIMIYGDPTCWNEENEESGETRNGRKKMKKMKGEA